MPRKIAANYIFLPGQKLVKNGYVVDEGEGNVQVVDTGGQIREMQGLEFYGGILVPDYVKEQAVRFVPGCNLWEVLTLLYQKNGFSYKRFALVEKADLQHFTWRPETTVRLLF